jgi:hypothetical protein
MTAVEDRMYGHNLLGAKGYVRSNHNRRSENERRGEGVHRPVAAQLGSMVGRHGLRWSSSARGSDAWKATGLRAKRRAVRSDSYLGQS